MRISPLTELSASDLEKLASMIETPHIRAHVTTTELSLMLGVSQDTIKRRLTRERAFSADNEEGWHDLPRPYGDGWRTRAAEWDLVVVLRWLAQRPMRRQV